MSTKVLESLGKPCVKESCCSVCGSVTVVVLILETERDGFYSFRRRKYGNFITGDPVSNFSALLF